METKATQPETMPRIGEKAPAFKAVTTQGEISFPDQYSGHWVILFSHPADFTPVCTSEFMVQALKTADAFSVATPADWRPGYDVIGPPAGSCGVAKDRMEGAEKGVTCHDWFFCTRAIEKAAVLGAIVKGSR